MSDTPQFTPQMAANPALPPELQARIASERPDLLPWLASNPSLYPELRAWIATSPDPQVQAALAAAAATAPSAPTPPAIQEEAAFAQTQFVAPAAPAPARPRSRKPLVITVAVVAVLALVGGGLAWWFSQSSKQDATAGATYKGYEMHCGDFDCIGLKSSGDAVALSAKPDGFILEGAVEFPAGSTVHVNPSGVADPIVVSPDGPDAALTWNVYGMDAQSWDVRKNETFILPPDSTLVWPFGFGSDDGFALSKTGDLWRYESPWDKEPPPRTHEPEPVETPWPVTEALGESFGSVWILGEAGPDGTPLAFLDAESGETQEVLIPGKVREFDEFPLVLEDGSVVLPDLGDRMYSGDTELSLFPLKLPGKAKEASATRFEFMVLLEDGSVYAPDTMYGPDVPRMIVVDLPEKAVSVRGSLILLDDGTVWMPDPDTQFPSATATQGLTAVQVDLPSPAKALMGSGWILLRDGSPAYVGHYDNEVYLLDPDSAG